MGLKIYYTITVSLGNVIETTQRKNNWKKSTKCQWFAGNVMQFLTYTQHVCTGAGTHTTDSRNGGKSVGAQKNFEEIMATIVPNPIKNMNLSCIYVVEGWAEWLLEETMMG